MSESEKDLHYVMKFTFAGRKIDRILTDGYISQENQQEGEFFPPFNADDRKSENEIDACRCEFVK